MVDIYHNMSQIFDEILFGTPASVTGRKGDGRQLFFLFIGSLFSLLCKDVELAMADTISSSVISAIT